ncbi:hypothetical protein [Pedobacter boryungensis]|uniref:Outer membrane protein beta-barrel domain-containing protein n=1 Tax=Pedobacter boryungensis TaxID=869962 RepID=A0ABX2DAT7_9SPHI|nr:hypothetical protein [Pedobacter boryungensis]NQX31175.1 hypothetical protein [Pedobacter boryungensis]
MKKLLFSIFCLLISYSAFSQIDGNYNYSIGVRGYSSIQMPKILNQTNSQSYTNTYFNGALVKFNDNQISYRLSGNYFRKDISFYNECENCEIASGTVTDYSFKVGFEKSLNYARIQPYFGSDLGFRANRFTGDVKTTNPKNMNMPYNVDAEKNGFIFTPLLGIRVSPVKQLSFFAETSLDFYYSYERQEAIQQDAANTTSISKYNKWEFLLNPISIGIQIHLVSKN